MQWYRGGLGFEAHRLLYHSAQRPSRTCNESKEEEEDLRRGPREAFGFGLGLPLAGGHVFLSLVLPIRVANFVTQRQSINASYADWAINTSYED